MGAAASCCPNCMNQLYGQDPSAWSAIFRRLIALLVCLPVAGVDLQLRVSQSMGWKMG